MAKSSEFLKKLNAFLNSMVTMWVVTYEEERFFNLLRKIAQKNAGNGKDIYEYEVMSWSVGEGLLNMKPYLVSSNNVYRNPEPVKQFGTGIKQRITQEFGNVDMNASLDQPIVTFREAYDYIMMNSSCHTYIIKDFHNFFEKNRSDYPENVRRMRDIIFHLRTNNGNLIFLSPSADIPPDLQHDVQSLDMPRPDDGDIEDLLNVALSAMKANNPNVEFDINYTKNGKLVKSKNKDAEALKQKFIYNLRGLSETEITQVISYAAVRNFGLKESSLEDIKESKKEKIAQFEFMEFIPTPNEVYVGGHSDFKSYIEQRGLYLDADMRDAYNLKAPKGTLVVGIPGCGKSVLAKYVAWRWGIPLIRLDMGAIYGKYLGQSEGHLREALRLAESNAPCVLWIDEVEKAVGTSSGDSGTSTRVFGKLLTWMSEREDMVYMYCTANNIKAIPQEFTRAGRFDTIRWADLPTPTEAADIIKIHCKLNGLNFSQGEIDALAKVAFYRELTGSEIEQAVKDANFNAARKAKETGAKIPVDYMFVHAMLETIKAWSTSHKIQLQEWRREALNNYEFTSDEVKKIVEKALKS